MTQPEPVEPPASQPSGPVRIGMPFCPNPHDWSRYNLNQIATMLRGQSPEAGTAAITMWTAIETLCREQAARLRKALQDLAERWPPTQEAASEFQMWGASLVRAMEDTAEVAQRNRPVVANISEEIGRARARIDDLMSEQVRYQELERNAGSLVANASHFGNELLDGDLDFSGWRSALDRDAREVIADLEQKIYNYALDLYADPPYRPPLRDDIDQVGLVSEDFTTTGGAWGGGSFVPSAGGWSGAWEPPNVSTSSQGPVPARDPALRDSGSSGNPGPVVGSGPDGDTVLDGVVPDPSSPTGARQTGPGGAFVDTPWGRVLAPGGVIGAPVTGGTGVGPPPGGQSSAAAPAVAGLVPATGPATRAAGGPGVVPFVPPMVPGRAGSAGASTTGGRRSRPGLPGVFDTPEGPPGVIQPPAEPAEHHPGPGVIGIDR